MDSILVDFLSKLQSGAYRGPLLIASCCLVVVTLVAFFIDNYASNTIFGDVNARLRREESFDALTRMSSEDPTKTSETDKVLNPATFRKFQLLQVTKISHNTKLLRFEIPGGRSLGLTIGRHVSVRADVRGKPVMRAYTPTSRPDVTGTHPRLLTLLSSPTSLMIPFPSRLYLLHSITDVSISTPSSMISFLIRLLRIVSENLRNGKTITSIAFVGGGRFS